MDASAWFSSVIPYSGSSAPIIRFDQSNILWRSSWGTPRMSAMAWRGSSAATSTTKSHSPRSATWSTIAVVRVRSVSPSSWTIRGVKPRLTIRR